MAEFYWTETSYDGTRMTRGAEACSGPRFHQEGWYGLQFYLPASGFPMDKTQGIAQIFSLGGCSSWASMLIVDGNDLRFTRRGHCATPPDADVLIAANIERNQWHSVVIHFIASHAEAGATEVWYDEDACSRDTPTYSVTGINYGFGDWDGDSLLASPLMADGWPEVDINEIELKIGMYNFDSDNYDAGEERTIYYDNVSMVADEGDAGWAIVTPTL